MGITYLHRDLAHEPITTELADDLYLKEFSPLEKMINKVVGAPDEGRLSIFDHQDGFPRYLVAYTSNNGNTFVNLTYMNFGVTDDCEVSIDIIFGNLAPIAREIIATGKPNHLITARGGLNITFRDNAPEKITYWSQMTKNIDPRLRDAGTDLVKAYTLLREQCARESVRMKANADQYVRNLAMDGILDAAECTDN